MAAYAYTATLIQDRAARLHENVGLALLSGKINVTNYNATTKPVVTEISGRFGTVTAVTFSGCSDSGHVFRWDDANNKIECFYADYDAVADGALIECPDDVDAGECSFIAIGLV